MFAVWKRLFIGTPIASSEEHHQRLSKKVALPVFASDAISSTAYATDEILLVLLLQAGVGAVAFTKLVPIAIIVVVLLIIVVTSYSPDDLRLPERRWQLHRQQGEPGHDPVAGRRHRRCSSTTSSPSPCRWPAACSPSGRRSGSTTEWTVPICLVCILADDGRQPARRARSRARCSLRRRTSTSSCCCSSSASAATGSSCKDLGADPARDAERGGRGARRRAPRRSAS